MPDGRPGERRAGLSQLACVWRPPIAVVIAFNVAFIEVRSGLNLDETHQRIARICDSVFRADGNKRGPVRLQTQNLIVDGDLGYAFDDGPMFGAMPMRLPARGFRRDSP